MKKKINKYFIVLTAVVAIITAVCSMCLFYHFFQRQVFDDLKAYSHILEQLDSEAISDDTSYNPWEDELRITLVDPEGTVIYDSMEDSTTMENHLERPEIQEAVADGEGTAVRWSKTSSAHTFYYAVVLSDGNILRLGKESDSIFRLMVTTGAFILFMTALVILMCSVISHFLTKKLIVPIEKVAMNMDAASAMDNVYEEIRPFISTIREQHVNILKSAKMRQEFTANVSHELKTPLTAISGYAELIGNGMTDEKDTVHFANEIHQNSNRLLDLINDIIKLSQLDDSELRVEFESVDLYDAAQSCLDMLEIQANKLDVKLRLVGEHCIVSANKNLIEELMFNLCSNAIRYNNRGGSVVVTVQPEGSQIKLSVRDTGIGISKEHQERIFERFYRVDKSRSKTGGGTGLGLAIVKHIVVQHDAHMKLVSEEGKGTEITVLF